MTVVMLNFIVFTTVMKTNYVMQVNLTIILSIIRSKVDNMAEYMYIL